MKAFAGTFGSPAITWPLSFRPVALRHCLSTALPFRCIIIIVVYDRILPIGSQEL